MGQGQTDQLVLVWLNYQAGYSTQYTDFWEMQESSVVGIWGRKVKIQDIILWKKLQFWNMSQFKPETSQQNSLNFDLLKFKVKEFCDAFISFSYLFWTQNETRKQDKTKCLERSR